MSTATTITTLVPLLRCRQPVVLLPESIVSESVLAFHVLSQAMVVSALLSRDRRTGIGHVGRQEKLIGLQS